MTYYFDARNSATSKPNLGYTTGLRFRKSLYKGVTQFSITSHYESSKSGMKMKGLILKIDDEIINFSQQNVEEYALNGITKAERIMIDIDDELMQKLINCNNLSYQFIGIPVDFDIVEINGKALAKLQTNLYALYNVIIL